MLKNHYRIGFQSKELIVSSGLNLGDVDQYPTIDITLDGADEYVQSCKEIKLILMFCYYILE